MRRVTAIPFGTLLLILAGCDEGGSSAPEGPPVVNDGGGNSDPEELSVAYKLAVVDGDPSEEAAFQDVIDCIMATGIAGAETEEKVGDTLVASWQASGKSETLLEWSQALC